MLPTDVFTATAMKILLVEDDEQLAAALIEVLVDKQHYVVDAVTDGEMGWE